MKSGPVPNLGKLTRSTAPLDNQWGDVYCVPLVSLGTAIREANLRVRHIQRVFTFSAELLSGLVASCPRHRSAWDRFVAVRIGAKEAQGMDPLICSGSLLVIDRHYTSLKRHYSDRDNLYAASLSWSKSAHLAIRYAQFEGDIVVLRRYVPNFRAEVLKVPASRMASDLIVGRIVLNLRSL